MSIHFTAKQRDYLAAADFLPEDLKAFVASAAPKGRQATVALDRRDLKRLGDALTVRLARFGFDADCAATAEGPVLEDLIGAVSRRLLKSSGPNPRLIRELDGTHRPRQARALVG